MDGKLVEFYLNRLEELVIDEDKIVTYKSVSNELEIHINTAKQLLQMFLSRVKTKKLFSINATFILCGKLADGSLNISIVNQNDLEACYSKFSEITSEHIYSIQQGEKTPKLKLLCNINQQNINFHSSQFVIKCSKSIIKSKSNSSNENIIPIKQEIVKNKEKNIIVEKPEDFDFTQDTEINSKTAKECTYEGTAQNNKCLDNHKFEGNSKKKQNCKENKNKKNKNNITTFFSSAVQKNVEKISNPPQNKSDPVSIEENKTVSDNDLKQKVELNEENKLFEKQSHGKKFNKNQKENTAVKRKRIQLLSDSEESDDDLKYSNEETEVAVEENPGSSFTTFQKEEETLSEEQPLCKRKKRKIVDKTVINEDGYMETRKEYILESESEKEEEDSVVSLKMKKSLPKSKLSQSIEKKSPKKKQASLLTFFSKK